MNGIAMRKNIFIILLLFVSIAVHARTPEEKCGTISIMKTLRGDPGGMNPELLAVKRITRPSLPYNYDTPEGNFKIHYALDGFDAVDSVGYAHKIGDYMEHCWSFYIDSMGYLSPPSDGILGGDSRYDVYLRNISAYGMTYPGTDGGQPWDDLTSYIELDNDYDGVYPNDDPDGPVAGAMRVTSAHELHHAFQFGLYGGCGVWIAEMSSVSMEERLYPLVNDYVWLIDYMLEAPDMPINYNYGWHMYGMGLYAQYWNMVYGDAFLATVWDTMRYIHDEEALFGTCAKYSIELAEDMADFACRALFVGSRDCGFFPDGAGMSDMDVCRTHSSYPASGTPSPQPYGYGMSFILFEEFGGEATDMVVEFDGADGADWAVRAVWKNGDSIAVYPIYIGDFGVGEVTVPLANNAEMIGLAVVPIGDYGERYNYSYSSSLVPSSINESEFPDEIEFCLSPNPFNSVCEIKLPEASDVIIYNLKGQIVRDFSNSKSRILWDGRNSNGDELPSGVYYIALQDVGLSAPVVLLK